LGYFAAGSDGVKRDANSSALQRFELERRGLIADSSMHLATERFGMTLPSPSAGTNEWGLSASGYDGVKHALPLRQRSLGRAMAGTVIATSAMSHRP